MGQFRYSWDDFLISVITAWIEGRLRLVDDSNTERLFASVQTTCCCLDGRLLSCSTLCGRIKMSSSYRCTCCDSVSFTMHCIGCRSFWGASSFSGVRLPPGSRALTLEGVATSVPRRIHSRISSSSSSDGHGLVENSIVVFIRAFPSRCWKTCFRASGVSGTLMISSRAKALVS